jgi:hypothetical protein
MDWTIYGNRKVEAGCIPSIRSSRPIVGAFLEYRKFSSILCLNQYCKWWSHELLMSLRNRSSIMHLLSRPKLFSS